MLQPIMLHGFILKLQLLNHSIQEIAHDTPIVGGVDGVLRVNPYLTSLIKQLLDGLHCHLPTLSLQKRYGRVPSPSCIVEHLLVKGGKLRKQPTGKIIHLL